MSNQRKYAASILSQSLFVMAGLLACLAGLVAEAHAQTLVQTSDAIAPPPLKVIPDELRTKLAEAREAKGRSRLSLEMADQTLERAAQFAADGQFDLATAQMGIYQALIEDLIRYLQQDKKASKSRDIFKRIELTLRSDLPRIEAVRRATPSEHAIHIKAAIDFVRRARGEALNAFYGHTVMRDDTVQKEKSYGDTQSVKEPDHTP